MAHVIRDLTSADVDRVLELNNAAAPAVPTTSAAQLADLITAADHAFGVHDTGTDTDTDTDGDRLLGFLIGLDPGRDYSSENYSFFEARGTDFLYVDRIVVDEASRGRRVGQLLYDRAFQLARSSGRAEVTCEVNIRPPNPRSLAFHARLGFVEVARQATKEGAVDVALLAASTRTRVVAWEDPLPGAREAQTMAGLDYLKALLAGDFPPPPIAGLMRMTPVAADVGTTTFECDPDESHYNPIGTVHGGLMCTLLDSVIGCAVHTTLPAGMGYTSIEIKVNYLRAVSADTGRLTAVGTVTKSGRRVAFAEGTVVDAAGRLVATASGTFLVFPVP